MAILADELTRRIRLESKQRPPAQSGQRLGNARGRDTRRDAQARPQRGRGAEHQRAPVRAGSRAPRRTQGRVSPPDGRTRRAGRRYAAENQPEGPKVIPLTPLRRLCGHPARLYDRSHAHRRLYDRRRQRRSAHDAPNALRINRSRFQRPVPPQRLRAAAPFKSGRHMRGH